MTLFIDFILVAGVVISAFILCLLIKAPDKKTPKKLLVAYFAYILVVILHSYAILHHIELLYKATFIFDFTIIWLFAPLLFVYIKSIFLYNKKLIRKNSLHFIPFFLISIFIGLPIVFTLYNTDLTLEYLSVLEENQRYIVVFRNIYFMVYLILSLKLFKSLKNTIKHSTSNVSEDDLKWIEILLYGCFIFISFDLILRWFENALTSYGIGYGYLTIFLIIILTTYLGLNGVSRSKILIPNFLIKKESGTASGLIKKNSLSGHSAEEIAALKQKLTSLMAQNKYYLNPELTLTTLADEIDISDKKLSTLLNKHLLTNFYDYVNSFRIEEVKKRLQNKDNEKFTLSYIALDCGFNSKASFNRVFKKTTNLSPSQYLKQYSF